jgi:hypothetical protein
MRKATTQTKIPKMKVCKVCKEKFTPARPLQMLCSVRCSYKYVEILQQKKAKAEKKDGYEKLKSHSDYVQELQKVFNEFIRLRDKGKPCISCGTMTGQVHAGHYRTTKACPELRFCEIQVWRQCATCNNFLSGNILNYRKELINRIGIEKVEWVEGDHNPKKYLIPELIKLKIFYRKKIKTLKQ